MGCPKLLEPHVSRKQVKASSTRLAALTGDQFAGGQAPHYPDVRKCTAAAMHLQRDQNSNSASIPTLRPRISGEKVPAVGLGANGRRTPVERGPPNGTCVSPPSCT